MTLMAVKDPVFRIVDQPLGQTGIPLMPFSTLAEAEEVLTEAAKEKPDIHWGIVGNGPLGGSRENRWQKGCGKQRSVTWSNRPRVGTQLLRLGHSFRWRLPRKSANRHEPQAVNEPRAESSRDRPQVRF